MQQPWYVRLQRIDRRIVYLFLVAAVAFPMFTQLRFPTFTTPETQAVYDAVERWQPGDGPVLIMADWGAASWGENGPQTQTVVAHCLDRGVPFAIMSTGFEGPIYTSHYADQAAPAFGREYGKDWVNFGFKAGPNYGQIIAAFMPDVVKFVQTDAKGTPLTDHDKLPIMRNVRTLADFYMVYAIGAGTTINDWVGLAKPRYPKVLLSYGGTAVTAPEVYPLMDSKQVVGLLVGMAGAAEYETLNAQRLKKELAALRAQRAPPERLQALEKLIRTAQHATWGMSMQSAAHLLVILFVIVGNLAYLYERRRAALDREARQA